MKTIVVPTDGYPETGNALHIASTIAAKTGEKIQLLPIADLDLGQVVAYCEFYSDFIEASDHLKDAPIVVETDKGSQINPWFNAKEKAHQRMQSIARTIGMTVDSRLKIIAPKQEESGDAYDNFFDN